MITVFTSCFNQGEHLAEAIRSVLSQSFADFEYLLFDDGSTDDTWEIMQHFAARDNRIRATRLAKQANVGVVINMSIRFSRGKAWVWVPADDRIHSTLLYRKRAWARHYPETVIYSHGQLINAEGTPGETTRPKAYTPEQFREALKDSCPIGLTGLYVPESVFKVAGMFPEHLNYSEDFYWMLKACRAGVDFRCIPEILYDKRLHNNRITSRHHDEIIQNIERIRREVGWYR
jgi:glycosyltransferase involved in cell wall biosynthesis